MRVEVRFRGLEPSEALRAYARRRIHFHLSRFEQRVTEVVLRLTDDNGPKGGCDKQCHVMLSGPRFGPLMLDERQHDPYAAIDLAVDRVARVVARCLGRARAPHRQGSRPRWRS